MAPSLENWTSARPEVAGSEDTWLPRGRRAGAGPPETNCGVKSRGTIVSDNLLSTQDRQEALSRAYASAVAAGAGYVTYIPDYGSRQRRPGLQRSREDASEPPCAAQGDNQSSERR